jgi:thiamine pyrophosphokinase
MKGIIVDKKKALIIANGDIDEKTLLKTLEEEYAFDDEFMLICADGGFHNCLKMGLYPDLVIGDLDSIEKKEDGIKYISYNKEKDESDTQLALDYALRINMEKIIITGAIGNRIDHSLANIFLLANPTIQNEDVCIVDHHCEIKIIKKTSYLKGKINQTVSLFSLAPYSYIIRTDGLKYPLNNEKLIFSPVRGLSNVFTNENAFIDMGKGCIAIFKNF